MDRIVVVAPTEHLKRQWADSADRVGIRIDPMFKNGDGMFGRHYQGVAITYAQVGMNHWSFVSAAYAVALGGSGVLALVSWLAMKRAEK